MTDWQDWTKKAASELTEDRSMKIFFAMSSAAILLIAVNAPMEERKQLMGMADGLRDLRPSFEMGPHTVSGGDPRMSDDDRLARIAAVEARFREFCKRNSIAPEEPLPEEMRETVRRVLSERKQATDPLKLAIKRLEDAMEQVLESGIRSPGADVILGMDEYMRFLEEANDIKDTIHKIHFLGPYAVDMSESQ